MLSKTQLLNHLTYLMLQDVCDANDGLSFYLLESLFYLYLQLLRHETYWQRRKRHSQRHLIVTDILLHRSSTLYHCI